MALLTLERLRSIGACAEQMKVFEEAFGVSVDVTVALCESVASKFDWGWAARNILKDSAQAEYDRATEGAQAEYYRVRDAAQAEFERATRPALAEYYRVRDAAQAEYDRATEGAQAEYYRVRDAAQAEFERATRPAMAEFERATRPALAEFERATRPAMAEYNRVRAREFGRAYAAGGAA